MTQKTNPALKAIKSTPWFKALVILAVVGILSGVASFFTTTSLCLFYNITGVPCPSCGMTRGFKLLLSGKIFEALAYHPMLWVVPAIPAILFSNWAKLLTNKWTERILLLFAIAFVVAWVVRLIIFFPHSEPMKYYSGGLLPRLFSALKSSQG